MFKNTLFRHRIFLGLVFITLLFLSAMAAINYYQNSKNFEDRKILELQNVNLHIQENATYLVEIGKYTDTKSAVKDKIFEFASVYNLNMRLFDLDGHFVASNLPENKSAKSSIFKRLQTENLIIKDSLLQDGIHKLHASYSYLTFKNTPVAVLYIESIENTKASSSQAAVLLKQYALLIIFLLILSAFVAWLISQSLTKKINGISEKIKNTNIANFEDVPLLYDINDEIKPLVDAYNQMQTKINDQTKELQKTERTEAWKEMARQVAHEINNPLTPLRLTIQNFHRKFNPNDVDNKEKVKNLTKTVVHQIDTISAITKSFSDFAKMPINSDSEIDIVETIRNTLNIFPPEVVNFTTNVEHYFYTIDNLYLTRIITNIVKNGIQAIPSDREKKIEVHLKIESQRILITIADNGDGISDENKERIFHPNFTTKSEGMGLGLSMVKKIVEDYNGKIWFESQQNYGTVFFIEFLKN